MKSTLHHITIPCYGFNNCFASKVNFWLNADQFNFNDHATTKPTIQKRTITIKKTTLQICVFFFVFFVVFSTHKTKTAHSANITNVSFNSMPNVNELVCWNQVAFFFCSNFQISNNYFYYSYSSQEMKSCTILLRASASKFLDNFDKHAAAMAIYTIKFNLTMFH